MTNYRESGLDRSVLITAFTGRVFGVKPDTGHIIWEQRFGSGQTVEIAIMNDRVYATDGLILAAFDYQTGRKLRGAALPDKYKGRATLVVERGKIFVASRGEVTCFSMECEPIWTQSFRGKGVGPVALGFPGNVRQADHIGQ